jgi:hypothetical protein
MSDAVLQIYAVSRQALSLVAGGAIDVFLLGQLRLLRQVLGPLLLLNVALALLLQTVLCATAAGFFR